jgi:hypothetical protein
MSGSESILNNSFSWSFRNCPSCNNANIGQAELSSKNQAEKMSYNSVRDYFIGIRNEQVFFSYYRCLNCALLYCPYYLNETQLDALYADMPDNLLGAEKSTAARTQKGYFNWFKQFVDKVDTYLELGPDLGLISKEIVGHYKPSKSELVEPNVAMHGLLQELSSSGTKVGVFRNLDECTTTKIDLTIGIHVFDHLLNPLEQLKSLNNQTKAGGYIGIVVHNESSLLRRLLGTKWPPFCLQHPQLFNRKSLKELLQKAGFEQVGIARSTNHFRIKHIGSLAIDVVGLPNFFKKTLPNWEMPISLGNQIGIFRKPLSK